MNKAKTCQNCEDRHPCCHDTCEFYQARKREHDRLAEIERHRKEEDDLFIHFRYAR